MMILHQMSTQCHNGNCLAILETIELIWWIFCSEYSIHTPSDSVTSAPASLMQKNPQRRKIICGMRLV